MSDDFDVNSPHELSQKFKDKHEEFTYYATGIDVGKKKSISETVEAELFLRTHFKTYLDRTSRVGMTRKARISYILNDIFETFPRANKTSIARLLFHLQWKSKYIDIFLLVLLAVVSCFIFYLKTIGFWNV